MRLNKDSVVFRKKKLLIPQKSHLVGCSGEQVLSSVFPHLRLNLSSDTLTLRVCRIKIHGWQRPIFLHSDSSARLRGPSKQGHWNKSRIYFSPPVLPNCKSRLCLISHRASQHLCYSQAPFRESQEEHPPQQCQLRLPCH